MLKRRGGGRGDGMVIAIVVEEGVVEKIAEVIIAQADAEKYYPRPWEA
jgi:hypothetical protein